MLFDRHATSRIIDNGRVYCTRRSRDIDIDLCCGCPWLLDMHEEHGVSCLRCEEQRYTSLAQIWLKAV